MAEWMAVVGLRMQCMPGLLIEFSDAERIATQAFNHQFSGTSATGGAASFSSGITHFME
jgi:hypothetical protein